MPTIPTRRALAGASALLLAFGSPLVAQDLTPKQTIAQMADEVWSARTDGALATWHDDGFTNHTAPFGVPDDYAGLEASMAMFLNAFSDTRLEIHEQVAEGAMVTTRVTFHGTHSGEFFGMPATGKTVSMAGMRMDRVANGQITDHWAVFDTAGLMQQLQAQ